MTDDVLISIQQQLEGRIEELRGAVEERDRLLANLRALEAEPGVLDPGTAIESTPLDAGAIEPTPLDAEPEVLDAGPIARDVEPVAVSPDQGVLDMGPVMSDADLRSLEVDPGQLEIDPRPQNTDPGALEVDTPRHLRRSQTARRQGTRRRPRDARECRSLSGEVCLCV